MKVECPYHFRGVCGAGAVVSYLAAVNAVTALEARLEHEEDMAEQTRARYMRQLADQRKILAIWEMRLPDMAVIDEDTGGDLPVPRCSIMGIGECSGRPD